MNDFKAGDRVLICIEKRALLGRVMFTQAFDGMIRVRCKGQLMAVPADCLKLDSVSA